MPKLALSAKVRMNVGNIWIDDWTNLWRYLHPFKILGKGIERSNEKMMSDFSLKVTFSERKTSFPNYFWQRSNEIVSNHQFLKLKKSRGIEFWKLNNISHLNIWHLKPPKIRMKASHNLWNHHNWYFPTINSFP